MIHQPYFYVDIWNNEISISSRHMQSQAYHHIIYKSQDTKQPKCLSADEWKRDTDDGILFNSEKREILLFMITWKNLKDMLSKISQSLQMLYDLTHMWNLKMKEWNGNCQGVGGGPGGKWEMVVRGYTLPVIRWISSGDLYSRVAVVNNNVLYTWKLPRDCCVLTTHTKKMVTMWDDN